MKKTIQTRLDKEDIKQLEKIAETEGHTLSSLVRYIVKLFLKNKGKKK